MGEPTLVKLVPEIERKCEQVPDPTSCEFLLGVPVGLPPGPSVRFFVENLWERPWERYPFGSKLLAYEYGDPTPEMLKRASELNPKFREWTPDGEEEGHIYLMSPTAGRMRMMFLRLVDWDPWDA